MADEAKKTKAADMPVRQEDCPVIGGDKKVKHRVPKALGKYQFDKFVSLNGKNYLIKPGSVVTVPKAVRDLILQGELNEAKANDYYYSHIFEE